MRNRKLWQIVFVLVTLNLAESLAAQNPQHITATVEHAGAVNFAT